MTASSTSSSSTVGPRVLLVTCSVAILSILACVGCSSSTLDNETSEYSERPTTLVSDSGSRYPESPHSVQPAAASVPLEELLVSASRGVGYDYEPLRDPAHAFATADIVVTGYLVDIVSGVYSVSTRPPPEPRTDSEIRDILKSFDDAIAHLEAEDVLTEEMREQFEAAKLEVQSNSPRISVGDRHVAFRVSVDEVLHGDVEAGDVLDINVYYSNIMPTVEEMATLLKSIGRSPRTVVGATWWSPLSSDQRELRNSAGDPIDKALFPQIDLFWFDGATWNLDDEKTSGQVLERPHPEHEALYLDGLHEMEPGWGDMETLDDLADALRDAAPIG